MAEENEVLWGIVELMGRQVIAGKISKSTMFGPELLRVDVPATKGYGAFSKFFGSASIYAVTPVSEEVALLAAERAAVNPVTVYVPELVAKGKYDELVDKYHRVISELNEAQRPQLEGGEEDDDDDYDPDL